MWRLVKWPKLAAIGCFFLPWLTVSCAEQRVASASGWNLILGRIAVMDPLTSQARVQSVHPNWWIALALFLTMAGAVIAFRSKPQPVTVLATASGALFAILLATSRLTPDALITSAAKVRSGDLGAAARAVIHLDWRPGYWATLGMLIAAAALAGLSRTARPDLAADPPRR